MRSFYNVYINPSSDVWFANIFPDSIHYLLLLLWNRGLEEPSAHSCSLQLYHHGHDMETTRISIDGGVHIRWNIIQTFVKEKGNPTICNKWMDLEGIMLNKKWNKSEKYTNAAWYHLYVESLSCPKIHQTHRNRIENWLLGVGKYGEVSKKHKLKKNKNKK